MLMETRCCKVLFQNNSKKNRLKMFSYRPLWGKRGGEERLFLISSVHAAARGVICDFTLKIVNTLIENNLMRR